MTLINQKTSNVSHVPSLRETKNDNSHTFVIVLGLWRKKHKLGKTSKPKPLMKLPELINGWAKKPDKPLLLITKSESLGNL